MTENEVSYLIRGAIFRVYNKFGPGLLESAYEAALAHELRAEGLKVESQVPVPFEYQGETLPVGFRIDLLVERIVVVEIKSVNVLEEVHHKQLLTYLRLTNLKLGLLVNFNCDKISQNIFRKVNGL